MSGTPPPGVSGYNWLRQSQLKSVINTSGLQLTQLKATDPKQICGRQIDSSVAVGGVGGIPITPDTITPDLIQGHAFVAPTYVANSFTGTAEVDIAGVLHSILTSVEFNNIPMNATKVLWLFKNTLSSTWTPWAETTIPGLPYPAPAQTLSFAYGQVTMGIHYDFGAAYVDLQGNTGVVSAFQTNFNPNNSIFKINSSYLKTFGGTFTPTFLSTPALSSPISANGISASVSMNFTINNQPQDGSLSRVSLWYRVTPSGGPSTSSSTAPYTFYGSVPAVGVGLPLAALPASGTYSFIFTDLTNSNSYDFAVSCEDASGGETRIVYGNTMLPQLIVLPAESLPTHPTNTYITASATSTQVAVSGQSSYYSQLSLSIFVTNGPGGAAIDPSPWLAQIRLLAKPLPVGSTTGDLDIDANDFTVCNAIFTNTITNPIVVTIGPFPANMDQEIAVQLIDQASKTSNADSFLIAMPPGPVYNSSGQLQYVSFGTPIQRIIAPDGTLQPQTVARAQMATPSTGNNLLFNPQGFYGTNYWVQYGGNGSLPPFFGHDNFDGGRFRLYGGLNTLVDWVAEQQLSNLTPGLPMVMSGLLEVDTFNASPGGSVAFEAYDPIADTILRSHSMFPQAERFKFACTFITPDLA